MVGFAMVEVEEVVVWEGKQGLKPVGVVVEVVVWVGVLERAQPHWQRVEGCTGTF